MAECLKSRSGHENTTKQLGAKEKARRKKCEARFSIIKKNGFFQKNCMRIG